MEVPEAAFLAPLFQVTGSAVTEDTAMAIRLIAHTANLETLTNQILLGDSAPSAFLWGLWASAVLDTLPVASIASRKQLKLLRQSVHLGSFAIQLVRTDGDRLSESELQHLLVGDEPLSEVFDAFVTPVTKAEAGSAAFLPFAQQVKPAVYIDCTGLGGHNLGGLFFLTFAFARINMANQCMVPRWLQLKPQRWSSGLRTVLLRLEVQSHVHHFATDSADAVGKLFGTIPSSVDRRQLREDHFQEMNQGREMRLRKSRNKLKRVSSGCHWQFHSPT